MSSSSTYYPGIKYCEIVKGWRKCKYINLDRHSLLFIFDGNSPALCSSEICNALIEKYGGSTFDGMRVIHTDSGFKATGIAFHTAVVQAHFSSIEKWKDALKESLKSTNSDKKIAMRYSYIGRTFMVKVLQPMPPSLSQSLLVYKFDGLPLEHYLYTIELIRKNMLEKIFEERKASGTPLEEHFAASDHLVDIIPGLFAERYFDGTVSVILKDWPLKIQFQAYGKDYTPSGYVRHYWYCKVCRYLDSHDEEDCPFTEHGDT